MEEEKKDYNYIVGIFDVMTKEIRNKISKKAEQKKPLGIGVYSDECCNTKLFTHPMKSENHRMDIASGLSGVNFTFLVDSLNPAEIEENAKKAYIDFQKQTKTLGEKKKYKAGFVIGSFDLLHAGHIENINIASELCERLYVIVKTDERIREKKHKDPVQNTTERANNLKFLRQVKGVLFYDLDSTRADVIEDVMNKLEKDYPEEKIKENEVAAIFGEDLKEKELEHKKASDWGEINLEFTPRSQLKMVTVSSSAYKKIVEETPGGIQAFNAKEIAVLMPVEIEDEEKDFAALIPVEIGNEEKELEY